MIDYPFTTVPATENLFDGLQIGILAEGVGSSINSRLLRFAGIRNAGISIQNGFLQLKGCTFFNCDNRAIDIETAQNVDIEGSEFTVDLDALGSAARTGLRIEAFALNSSLRIEDTGFDAVLASDGSDNRFDGIHLNGSEVGGNTAINILENQFSILGSASRAIFIEDAAFPTSSSINILNN